MSERSACPNLSIPGMQSRISAAEKLILGTVVLGTTADIIVNYKPRALDFMTTKLEDHVGNFPPGWVESLVFMRFSQTFIHKVFKEEVAKKMDPCVPIVLAMLAVVGTNVAIERLTNPNPEFTGDVISGMIGGAIGITHILLSNKLEITYKEKGES